MSTPIRELSTQAVAGYLAAHGIRLVGDPEAVSKDASSRACSGVDRKDELTGVLAYQRYDPSRHEALFNARRVEDAKAYEAHVTDPQGNRCRLVNHSSVLDPGVGIGENVDLVAGVCNYSGKHKELGIGDKFDVTV